MDVLENNRRLAAAVELVLQSEEGVREARVNPINGRVLVRYDPRGLTYPVETLLGRAVKTSPLTREEYTLFRAKPAARVSHSHLITAKIACCAFQAIFLGGLCPVGLAGAALFFLVHRANQSTCSK